MAYLQSDRLRDILNILTILLIVLETILSIVVTGITSASAHGFQHDLQCDSPSKLNYNIAAGVLTFLLLPIFFLLDKCLPSLRQRLGILTPALWLGIYAVFVVLWAAATGSSVYTCSDLCSACGGIEASYVIYAGKCCDCPGINGVFVSQCDAAFDDGGDDVVVGFERRHYWYEATQGLDSAVMVLFVLSVVVAVGALLVRRRNRMAGSDVGMVERTHNKEIGRESTSVARESQPPPYEE